MQKERKRIFSDKQSSKQQEQKPSYQQGQYELYQIQNQITNPQQVKNKLPTHQLDRLIQNYNVEQQVNQQRFGKIKFEKQNKMNVNNIGKKRDIIMNNQQQYLSNQLNQKTFNPKQQEIYQQQNNSSFYFNKQTHQIKQQAPKPQQIQYTNYQQNITNQKQNISDNLNFEPRKPQNRILIREIEKINQVGLIVKNEYDLNENQILKLPQVQEKSQPKKQFEGKFQNMEPKAKDVNKSDTYNQDVQQEQDYYKNQQILLNINNSLETQGSQNEQNIILDSNISILRTLNLSCFECNQKIEGVCIQTPCQHSFHKNCINYIMKKSLLQNGFQINCKCTEKLPQYFIRNYDQELFKKLLEQQIKKIENDQRKNNIDKSKEQLLFHPNQLLNDIQKEYENDDEIDIFKCYYHK